MAKNTIRDWWMSPAVRPVVKRLSCLDGFRVADDVICNLHVPNDVFFTKGHEVVSTDVGGSMIIWGAAFTNPGNTFSMLSDIAKKADLQGVHPDIKEAFGAAMNLEVPRNLLINHMLKASWIAGKRRKENKLVDRITIQLLKWRLGEGNPATRAEKIRVYLDEHMRGCGRSFTFLDEVRNRYGFEQWEADHQL